MHAAMHRARPDIKSLVHVHSPALTALSAMEEVPGDLLMIHASFWPENVPVWDNPSSFATTSPGARWSRSSAMLRSACCAGTAPSSSAKRSARRCWRAILAEQHARLCSTALSHGRPIGRWGPTNISRRELYARMLPPFTHDLHWHYESTYVELVPGAR